MVKAQMEIQQMAFMIVAVFIFFSLVGMFILRIYVGNLESTAYDLEREQALTSIEVIANMPELNFDSYDTMTLDEDKVRIMASGMSDEYTEFWPISSIEVLKLVPYTGELIECPGSVDCNYYDVYDNGQTSSQTVSGYVSLCRKEKESGTVYDRCEIAKLIVGIEDE